MLPSHILLTVEECDEDWHLLSSARRKIRDRVAHLYCLSDRRLLAHVGFFGDLVGSNGRSRWCYKMLYCKDVRLGGKA